MIIDVVCLIFAGYGFWVGYSKGIISTVLNLSSYFFGILAAMKFGPVMGDMIAGAMPSAGSSVSFLAGVVITFIIVLILFRLLARGLTGALESVNINFINQILGGVLSAIFFSLIFSGLLIFADQSRLIDQQTKDKSLTYNLVKPLPNLVWTYGGAILPVIQEFWGQAADAMDTLRENVEQDESDQIFDLED